jgi:hypothetical protein
MSDNINPTGSTSQTAVDLIPKFYQTRDNIKFIQSTIDQLVQKGTTRKVSGYIGRENAKSSNGNDVFVNAADSVRQNYQLEPGVLVNDQLGNTQFFKDYIDYINQLNVFGGNTDNHERINTQEFYSWDPHINWDKFSNFQQYYWLPYGPETITIYGQQKNVISTYTVVIDEALGTKEYLFTPNGLTRNPSLVLYRGQTYHFNITSTGEPFSIKTARTLGNQDRYIDPTQAIDNFAVTSGTVTFTVPNDAPDLLYYVSENDPNLGGIFKILNINENSVIDVENDFLGKKTYILSSGDPVSNGMKVSFGGNVMPQQYATGEYYVEGVGTAIILIPTTVLEVIGPYTVSKTLNYDETPFDQYPLDQTDTYAQYTDYVVINRGSKDKNPWSRYNRWFHKDVVATSARLNGADLNLDQTARAKRPIIEFEADLRLFNFGNIAIDDIDVIDTFTTDAFSTIEGSAGYNIDGVQLTEGMKVIFLADTDIIVQNNIYTVHFINIENAGSGLPQIHLELTSSPTTNNTVLVRQGVKYQGYMFWFDGSTWIYGQQKTSVNQPPLFDLVDNSKTLFSSYAGSTFKGTKLFSYKQGTGSNDEILGFPLSYQNINNIGDIKFEFNLLTDTFDYKQSDLLITKNINTGFLEKLDYANNISYINGWQTSQVTRYQPAVRIYKNSNRVNNFPLDIYNNKTDLLDLEVRIYVNGIRLDKANWSIADAANYKIIQLSTDIESTDVLTIKSFAKQPINNNGYYELPINLQNNPLNSDMTMFTLGEVSDHINSIVDNLQTTFKGTFPGDNNLRDLGNVTPYGTKFVQHSGPASLSLFHITSEDNNVVKALEKSRDDYGKFKRNFIAKAQVIGTHGDPVGQVDSILKTLTSNKSKLAPYYFSDMAPFGAKKISNYTVVDYRITTYPLTTVFDNTTLSNKAVSVYIGTNQLLYGLDYTFTTDGYINITASLTNGQTIIVYEYDSTDGCYIPATPTKLGLWPKYTPQIFLDTSFITPVKMIQGHDGSLILAYNDYRDDLILELEKRIYNNIKVSYDPSVFDVVSLTPGYSRTTEYKLTEFNQTLSPNFYNWITSIGEDFTKPLNFDLNNAFTYNFKGHSAPDGRGVPGYWRGIYRWMYDTDRPNLFPWEMLGFTEEPTWWTSLYGPAPYTNDNLVMWTDISLGAVRAPGVPVVYKPEYAKPFLLNHLPVDESGNLINPIRSNVAAGPSTSDIKFNFVFGDGSPAESAWRKSSYYPFSVISAFMILKPSKTFGLTLDKSRITRNIANQLVNTDTMLRIRPADIAIPSIYSSATRVQTSGIINYLVDELVHDNLSFYTQYQYSLQNLNIQLSYRIGSFTTKNNFNLLLDSKNPAATGSLFVPPEDYSIIYNSSSPIKKLSYSGVIVTKVDSGFEVKGYSLTKPYFNYYNWLQSSGSITIGGISSPYANWSTDQQYVVGQIVFYNGIYYRTTTNTLSGSTFNSSSFQKLTELPVSGGVTADFRKTWDTQDTLTIPYGTVLNSVQAVVDFLTGYGEWLKDQGFVFDDFNNNLEAVSNWETSAKEFMFWTTQNWSTTQTWVDWTPNKEILAGTVVKYNGDYYKALTIQPASSVFVPGDFAKISDINQNGNAVISLSPSANGLTFTANMSVVDDINNTFNQYEIFKVDGTSLQPSELNSIRQGNTVNYVPRNGGTIYNASFYLVQKEQIVILNNTTMFNDVIYNPTSGYRQERIKISGFVASQWFGGFEIPGFIFDRAEFNNWQPYTTYYPGDIVKQGQFYFQADPSGNIIQGSETLDTTQWKILNSKPKPSLIPNWNYKATQFTDFYNLDEDNFDTGQQQIAQHLVGYQDRQYLDNIIQDKVSEFQFYQGFIKEKGTQNSLNKLFDVLSADNKESLNFYEEWAIRVGQYGASSAFDTVEFILDESSTTVNPQGFHLVNQTSDTSSINFNIELLPKDLYLAPLDYNSNPFPYSEEFTPFLRSGGYVQPDSSVVQLPSLDAITSQTISNFKDGTFVWVPFYKTGWNIFRFTNSYFKIADVQSASNNTLTVFLQHIPSSLNVGDYVGLSQVPFAGFFKITTISKNTITISGTAVSKFSGTFGHQDEIVLFLLLPAKTSSIDNANDLITSAIVTGDKIWTDNDGTGHWSTWELQSAYTKNEISNQDNILTEFKYAVAWAPNTTYTLGTIISYSNSYYYTVHWFTSGSTFNSNVILLTYTTNSAGVVVTSTTSNQLLSNAVKSITPDTLSSFGQNIVVNTAGTIAVVYTAKGHVGTYIKVSGSQPWELNQVIVQPFIAQSSPLNANLNSVSTFGESLAMSADGSYLAIGSPNAGYATVKVDPLTGNYLCNSSGVSSVNNKTGAISLYQRDVYGNYNLVFTFVTGNDRAGEQFGMTMAFGKNTLFATARMSDGSSKVYITQLINGKWIFNSSPIAASSYSVDFGKSIVVSNDYSTVAIASPSTGIVYIYNLNATGSYVLNQSVSDPTALYTLTNFALTIVNGGYGFKNSINDVIGNQLQNIKTINSRGTGLTFNLGVDKNGVMQSVSTQSTGSNYVNNDQVTVINPLGTGAVTQATIVSSGTGYTTASNLPVGYAPQVATATTGIIQGNVFVPQGTTTGSFVSGMVLNGSNVPSNTSITTVDTVTVTNVTITGFNLSVGTQTSNANGNLAIGMVISGGGIFSNTYITDEQSGTWIINNSHNLTNITVTGKRYDLNQDFTTQYKGYVSVNSLTVPAIVTPNADGITSTVTLTDFPSAPIVVGTVLSGTGSGILTTSTPQGNVATVQNVISTIGTIVANSISGSGPLSQFTTYTNISGTAPVSVATQTNNQTFVITGSINGTVLTVSTLASGTIDVGYVLTGTNVVAGTYIVNKLSGSGAGSTWTVSQEQIVLSGYGNITGTLNLITVQSTQTMSVGSPIVFGTALGGLATNTPYYVTRILDNTHISVGTTLGATSDVSLSIAQGSSIYYVNGIVVPVIGSYQNVTQRYTSGSGTGATFIVSRGGLTQNYADNNATTISMLSPGTGYKIGDTITISGANLGGAVTTNDLTFTIDHALNTTLSAKINGMEPFASSAFPIGASFTATNLTGQLYQDFPTSVVISSYLDSNGNPTSAAGTAYTGIVYTITGGSVPVPGTIADITTQQVGAITYSNLTQTSTSGSGSEAVFTVSISGNTSVYQGSTTITVVSQGGNYVVGDTIKISGTDLGGNTPLNDLEFVVASVPSLPANTVVTANIDATNWTINKNYSLGTTNFTVTLTGLQTLLTVAGVPNGVIQPNQYIVGAGVTPNTTILSGSGNSWYLNQNFSIGSATSLVSFVSAFPLTNVTGNISATPGSGLTVNVVANVSGNITSVTINNAGTNYNSTDQLVIVGGNNNAIITPQSTLTIPVGSPYFDPVSNPSPVYGYSSITAAAGGTLILDFVQPTGTFFVGQKITISGGIDAGSLGSITGFTQTIKYDPSTLLNVGSLYTAYILAVGTIGNPSVTNSTKKSTSITISLKPGGSPVGITPGLITSVITPLVITAYYPGVTTNGIVKLVSVNTTQATTTDFGASVDLSNNGTYLAIGSNLYSQEYTYQGKVSVFQTGTTGNYSLYQTLSSPDPISGDFFGSKVAFMNDYETIVVYSAGSANSTTSTFDAGETTFDLNGTTLKDKVISSGKVNVFDMYNTEWICGETLITDNRSVDGYGTGFAIANNKIIVGAPGALDGTLKLPTGKVYVYEKTPGTFSWKQIQQQTNVPDLRKIKKAYLYNRVTSELIKHLDVIDPYYGKIAGPADQELSFKTFYDPAIYSYYDTTVYNADTLPANIDEGQAWHDNQVGQLWWDLRTAKFIDNHSTDLVYRNSTLNTLITGASIDVYEWVGTTYLPSDWASFADTVAGLSIGISGQPLYGNSIYSIKKTFNSFTGGFDNTYYYWVKNTIIVPAIKTRSISAASVASLIRNPKGEGYQFLSLTGTDSFSLSNVRHLLKGNDVVLAIEYWTTDNITQNIHNQWKLVSDNPTTKLPATIEEKWFDSLCGKDQLDRVVPDLNQPVKLRYGIENRPRQSMFVNRFEALKQFVEQVNLVLIKEQIVEQKAEGILDLNSYDTEPSVVSGLYDTTQDTDAELQYVSVNYIKTPSVTPIIQNGIITGINIINAGSGYLTAPVITINGAGTGASIILTINSSGSITGAIINSGGKGYIDGSTTLVIRPFSVLVHQDSGANQNWSIYGYDPINKIWFRTRTQNYDVRLFWSKVDWYGSYVDTTTGITHSYNQYSIIDFAVDTYSELSSITPAIGQTVKVRTTGSGGWQLLRCTAHSNSTDWTQSYQVIGIENGTIQLSNNLYNYTQNKVGFDGFLYDNAGYDFSASKELRIILNALKDKILTDTLKQSYLDLFFSSVRYAFNEQTYIDWAFKTSFVQAQHNLGYLKQTVVYTNDNLSDFENYVNEVTPYRTTVREYVDNYEALDTSSSMISDFDLPAIYNVTGNKVIETRVEHGQIVANDTSTLQTYPWKNWNDNLGFIVEDIVIISGGSGYITAPEVIIQSQSGKGAVAKAFTANGSVNRIVVLESGSGYLEAPSVILNGGLPGTSGSAATAIAIIGKSVIRSSLIKMKFDRVNQQYFTIHLDVQETFTGNNSQVQFPLTWAPDIKIGQSTVTIDSLIQLRETYSLAIKKTTNLGYTSYSGTITFVTPPAAGKTIVISYIKDISLLEAQDRIQFYYTPGTGSLGKDLSQLMTGIDYGGVQLIGLGYDAPQGWSSTGFMNDLWDSYEETYNSYSTTVTPALQQNPVFALPYTPVVYTNLNIYYTQRVSNTYVSDGVTTIYTGSPYYNQLSVTATINRTVQNVSTTATSTSTVTVIVTGTQAIYNYLFGSTVNLSVGTPVQFISGIVGGLVLNQTYYIKSIVDANTFTITAAIVNGLPDIVQTVTTQNVASMGMRYGFNNNVVSANSSNLAVGMPIQFTGTPFGNIANNTTYYVKTILNDQSGFTISTSYKNGVIGSTLILATASGTMTVNQVSGAGYSSISVSSTTGLKVGDALVVPVAGAVTSETVIKSIDSPTQITLSTILYGDIPNNSAIQFVRTLADPADYLFITNVDIQLNSPVVKDAVINFNAYLDSVRIDDPNYNKTWTITNTNSVGNVITAFEVIDFVVGNPIQFAGTPFGGLSNTINYTIAQVINDHQFTIVNNSQPVVLTTENGKMTATSIANTNAIMSTYIADGITNEVILPRTFSLNVNDIITFTNSSSDGSIQTNNSNVDTVLQGGDLAYSTATGLSPDDILVDGDSFVTPNTSPATEEVVPGQVVDTVAIKIFERPTGGSATMKVSNYIADGTSNRFSYGQYINTKQAIVIKSNNTILRNGYGLTDATATSLIAGIKYTITFVGTTNFVSVGASANTVGVQFIATGTTIGNGTATASDYNVDYRNQEVVFLSAPTAGTLLTIDTFGFNGSNLLDLDYYTGDGVTREFITRAEWSTDVNILIYVDGVPQTPEIFKTDNTYEETDRIAFRFVNAPVASSILNYLIVSGIQQTYSLVKTERLPTDGTNTTFTLKNTIGSSLPLESSIIVRANNTILKGPNASYFTIGSNIYKYTLDATTIQPYSINAGQLQVFAGGVLLTLNQDYTVDVSGITIAINRATYSAYKGSRLQINLTNSADYICTANTITFTNAYAVSDYVEVLSAYQHDILKIERTRTKASNNLSFTTTTPAYYKYIGILGGTINLQSSVIDENYFWVVKNGNLLSPSIDYKLNTDLTSITLGNPLSLNDIVEIIAFAGAPVVNGYSFMQFKDMLNRTIYKRLSKEKQTRLTQDLNFYDSYIYVNDAGNFDKPNASLNRPGVVEIHGERIEYFTIDGNKLGQLRRGTLGTGAPLLHKAGTYVQDIGPSETIPYTDIINTYQTTINGTTINTIIPLKFIPMNPTTGVSVRSNIDNWSLTGSTFGIFDNTTTQIVTTKTGTGPYLVTFAVPQLKYAPATGKKLNVIGSYNQTYNGQYVVAGSNISNNITVAPLSDSISGTFGVVTVVDDGDANENVTTTVNGIQTTNNIVTAVDDGGNSTTIYTTTDNVLDGTNASQNGATIQGSVVYSFIIPTQIVPPTTGIYYTVSGVIPSQYNGTFLCTSSTANSITIVFPINYGQITTLPTAISSTNTITLIYPVDPGTYSTLTPTTISAPVYGQADDIDVFVGGYDTSSVWTPNTTFTAGQIITINNYTYKITASHTSGVQFNSAVTTLDSVGNVLATGVDATTVRQFFVGNIRLKKHPYTVYNTEIAPDSPAGDVQFIADFAVDSVNNELVLSNQLTPGTTVTVVKRTGTQWAPDTGNITTSTTTLAKFLKLKAGISYQGLPK